MGVQERRARQKKFLRQEILDAASELFVREGYENVSMRRIADFLAKEQAKLWINHDKPSSDARRHAPEFYD